MTAQDTETISYLIYLTAEIAETLGENIGLFLEYEAALKQHLQQKGIQTLQKQETALQRLYDQVSELLSDRSLLWDFTNQYRTLYPMNAGLGQK